MWSIDEFERDAVRVAAVLRDHRVTAGSRVMLKAGNSAGWLASFYGLLHAGASVVLVDQRETAERATLLADQAGVDLLITDDVSPRPEARAEVLINDLMKEIVGAPARETFSLDEWAARPDGLIMCTSGSTGLPKGIVKSGASFLRNLERNADQVGHVREDVLMPLLPFGHQYGLSMVLIAWLRRCSLVVAPHRRLDHAMPLAAETGTTVIDATPSTYRSMLNILWSRPALKEALAGVRMFCVGAAPLDPRLVDDYVATFGKPLLDSYGSTELGNISFATIDNPVACGRVMPGIRVRVVDEQHDSLPAGAVGEIEVDCPDMMNGYLTEFGTIDHVRKGWWSTGDLGYLDEDDDLHVIGRKFAVTRMGYTLYPEVIEHSAAKAGCQVKIVALPDERRGAQLVFFVADDKLRDARYWRDRLCSVLAPYEHPNQIVVISEFPLNRNGKPDKPRLEEMAVADLATASVAV